MFAIESIAAELREVVAGLEPDTFAGRDAARLAEVCATGERIFSTAKALFAKRAVDTNGWRHGSQAISGEQWLANASGCSEGQARDTLKTAERLEALAATEAKLREGSLSLSQATLVTKAAEVDPAAEGRLLRTADRDGIRTLRDTSDRVIAAATDDETAHGVARRERHLRTWIRGMAKHGSFSGPVEEVDALLRAIQPIEQSLFQQARTATDDQPRESYDARCFDALIALARGDGSGSDSAGPPVARVRVDLPALLAGHTSPGEVCEIPGVGPVPVDHARNVLSHGLLELVITDGVDVQTVVSRTRHVPEALKVAIAERDERCKVRGCDRTHNLERHHTLEFHEFELTTYNILGMLCGDHHDLVTHRDHEIIDHHDGTWSLRPPAEQFDEHRDTHAA